MDLSTFMREVYWTSETKKKHSDAMKRAWATGDIRERQSAKLRKISEEQAAIIAASKLPSSKLQAQYGVSAATISRIRNGKYFKETTNG